MLVRDIVIGVLLFSIVLVGALNFSLGVFGEYNTTISTTYNASFENMTGLIDTEESLAREMQDKMEKGKGLTTILIFDAVYEVLKLPFKTIKSITIIITNIANTIGIPDKIFVGLIGIMIVTIVFLIAGAVLRREI